MDGRSALPRASNRRWSNFLALAARHSPRNLTRVSPLLVICGCRGRNHSAGSRPGRFHSDHRGRPQARQAAYRHRRPEWCRHGSGTAADPFEAAGGCDLLRPLSPMRDDSHRSFGRNVAAGHRRRERRPPFTRWRSIGSGSLEGRSGGGSSCGTGRVMQFSFAERLRWPSGFAEFSAERPVVTVC